MSRLAQVKRYPAAARARREEGTAFVRFSLSRGGRVAGVTLDRSSGSSLLDREALDTVRRAQPLPKVPADLPDPLTLTVAIEFALSS
jgi:protein TonB